MTVGTETREVRHFWFLNWPDFGVPVEDELLTCLKDVRQMSSAGVGRTGTFILLDWALQVLEHDSHINLFRMVREMRENRCRMVQTESQYIFAHDCIKTEIVRNKERESGGIEVTYVNQSFIQEPFYENSSFFATA
ncbi:hypothetical protein HELRODRAFT_180553 [Helobdella robusta]|uniref:Tyrosine-protein phosphatase domain-containing protein n=1 Tax=Helobdella robusta TaxID=6412 RepID=T1FG17_HELRO|nr:hypothetical protein HELRODRAFT_180553 [Helobdella robusta]ESN93901.1 hypothetical protein HELRODRAFT_180553 [Helobdella robusta]